MTVLDRPSDVVHHYLRNKVKCVIISPIMHLHRMFSSANKYEADKCVDMQCVIKDYTVSGIK